MLTEFCTTLCFGLFLGRFGKMYKSFFLYPTKLFFEKSQGNKKCYKVTLFTGYDVAHKTIFTKFSIRIWTLAQAQYIRRTSSTKSLRNSNLGLLHQTGGPETHNSFGYCKLLRRWNQAQPAGNLGTFRLRYRFFAVQRCEKSGFMSKMWTKFWLILSKEEQKWVFACAAEPNVQWFRVQMVIWL